jgi:hypothetical protein
VRRHEASMTYSFPTPLLLLTLTGPLLSQTVDVLTGQYNNSRTSANLHETILTPSNVSANTFGLLFIQTVDANFFAQPLYVHGLTIDNQSHNVVFVATMHDTVYAFDADTLQSALWQVSLGAPVTVPPGTQVGVLSTPVIDLGAQTLFVVAYASESGAAVYRLHALNLLTGAEIANVVVQAAVPGTGDDSQTTPCASGIGGSLPPPCIPFVASEVLQRPALLRDAGHGIVYLAFGANSSEETTRPYHGWLIGYHYSGGAFTQTTVFNSTRNAAQTGQACTGASPATNQCGHGGGIWMSGRGPAFDDTGIYVVGGNGGYGGPGTGNWAESALRLNGAGAVQGSFTPDNYAYLNDHDLDLGDAGAILFTSTNSAAPDLLLAAGKTGTVYVLNRDALGGFSGTNRGAVQVLTPRGCGTGPGQGRCYEIHSPALWARTNAHPLLYLWAYGDVLRAFDFDAATNQFTPDANQGTLPTQYYPGAGLAVSANGTNGGIVWGIVPVTNSAPGQGALYAFDAANVGRQLWVSADYWFDARFTIPTIANGKVYLPTSGSPPQASPSYSPQLRVYGLLAPRQPYSSEATPAIPRRIVLPYPSSGSAPIPPQLIARIVLHIRHIVRQHPPARLRDRQRNPEPPPRRSAPSQRRVPSIPQTA